VYIPRDPGLIHLIVNGELVAHVTAKHVQRVRARLRIHATPLLLEILLVEVRTLQEPLPRSLALSRIVDVAHADKKPSNVIGSNTCTKEKSLNEYF